MKIALCMPIHSRPETRFMANLIDMIIYTAKQRPDIELKPNIVSTSDIASGRNYLVKQALAWNVDWLLWMDADQAFPEDALLRLLARDMDAIGCNCRRRVHPHLPVASKNGTLIETTKATAAAGKVEEVDQVGLAFCLVRAAPLRQLEFPMFMFRPRDDGTSRGEDSYFWEKLRSVGVFVHLDHALSIDIGHIAERVIWND